MSALHFSIEQTLPGTLGRAGVISTPHGDIRTPGFTIVGTKATVKGLTPEDLRSIDADAVLANTYHLYLQPGQDIVRDAGGLHAFMHWDGPTLTDSGGFQVFSLGAAFGKGVTKFAKGEVSVAASLHPNVYSKEIAEQHGKLCVVDEDGVTFTSHLDGSLHRFTAERSIEIQHALGADIMFAFDECTSPTAPYTYQREALERTHRWAKRSILAHKQNYDALKQQALYGVVQGGRYEDLRKESASALAGMDFDGYGIGGSFSKEDLHEALGWVNTILPEEKPRHLLGIGEPEDIFMGVENGCDTFDCVAPTRIARTGMIYTARGKINLYQSKYQRDMTPPDPACSCATCSSYTRAYLAHLFRANKMLGARLASLHNLHFIVSLVRNIRNAILDGTYEAFKDDFLRSYQQG